MMFVYYGQNYMSPENEDIFNVILHQIIFKIGNCFSDICFLPSYILKARLLLLFSQHLKNYKRNGIKAKINVCC